MRTTRRSDTPISATAVPSSARTRQFDASSATSAGAEARCPAASARAWRATASHEPRSSHSKSAASTSSPGRLLHDAVVDGLGRAGGERAREPWAKRLRREDRGEGRRGGGHVQAERVEEDARTECERPEVPQVPSGPSRSASRRRARASRRTSAPRGSGPRRSSRDAGPARDSRSRSPGTRGAGRASGGDRTRPRGRSSPRGRARYAPSGAAWWSEGTTAKGTSPSSQATAWAASATAGPVLRGTGSSSSRSAGRSGQEASNRGAESLRRDDERALAIAERADALVGREQERAGIVAVEREHLLRAGLPADGPEARTAASGEDRDGAGRGLAHG